MILTVRELNAAMNAAKEAGGLQWLVDDCKEIIKNALEQKAQAVEMKDCKLTRNVKQLAARYDEHVHNTQFGRR